MQSIDRWRVRPAIVSLLTVLSLAAAVWVAIAGGQFRRWTWETTTPIRYTPDIERGFQWGRSAIADGKDASGHWHLYGLLNQYEKMEPEQPRWLNWLDYAPLRLAVMTAWAARSESQFPHVTRWADDRSYALTRPVLWLNAAMEAVAALAAFGLVRTWVRRCDRPVDDRGHPKQPPLVPGAARGTVLVATSDDGPNAAGQLPAKPGANKQWRTNPSRTPALPWCRGSELGLLAAAIFWLNPAVVLDAYGWPTWDVWVIPFFLLAAWAAVYDRWLWAGIAIGVGAMFKGQELAMVPVFVIWAIVAGRPGGAFRFATGVTGAIAVVALPWLVSYIPPPALAAARAIQMNRVHHPWDVQAGLFNIPRGIDWPGLCWIGCVVLVSVAALQFRGTSVLLMFLPANQKKKNMSKMLMPRLGIEVVVGFVALVLLLWPWAIKANQSMLWVGLAAVILTLACLCFVRHKVWIATTVIAVALLACPVLFHGSYTWWTVGIGFGARHWPRLYTGTPDNLPALLSFHFRWATDDLDAVVFTLPAKWLHLLPAHPVDVSIAQLLKFVCGSVVAVASVGIGLHFRRRDRRFLVALVTPWLLIYLIAPQMQERYLLFAAASACVCIADSIGTAALGLVLSLGTMMTTLQTMLGGSGNAAEFGKRLAREFPSLFDAGTAGGKITRAVDGAHPDFAWALLLCGSVYLYLSIAPSRGAKTFNEPSWLIRRFHGRTKIDRNATAHVRTPFDESAVTTPALPNAGQYPPRSESAPGSASPSIPG